MNNLDYSKVFEVLVKETANYVKVNNLKAMVLGISGGIDSTVVAAICHEVSKQTGIPLIGRSLPIKNKSDEFDVSKLVGEALCNLNAPIVQLSLTHVLMQVMSILLTLTISMSWKRCQVELRLLMVIFRLDAG